MWDLVKNPKDRFSCDAAHLYVYRANLLYHILQVSHYERRIRTLEADLRESKEQRKRALDEVSGIGACVTRKPVFGVSNQVRHKLGCTTIEDG